MKNKRGVRKLRFGNNCSLAHLVMVEKLEEFSVNVKVFGHSIYFFSLALSHLSLPQS
jgi:hypothetical protein